MLLRYLSQENEFYNEHIRRHGCYFLSILKLIEEIRGIEICHKYVEELYNQCVAIKAMREDCYIIDPSKIFEQFKVKVFVHKEELDYEKKANDLPYLVKKVVYKPYHFVLCRFEEKNIIKFWDSLFLTKNDYPVANFGLRVFSFC